MADPVAQSARFKSLHRKLETAVAHIGRTDDVSKMLAEILEHLCREFEDELGFEGGRIYTREGVDYVLCCGFGSSRTAPHGLRVPRDYPPHRRLMAEGIVMMARGDPGVDADFEQVIGVGSMFAAIGVGEGYPWIIAFSLKGRPSEEDVRFSLGLVRQVLNLKLQEERMAGMLNAARVVQEGILPREVPALGEFDIAALSQPAEGISGDLFDYLKVSDCCLGIAIADSSGHGLPAALLARDVITALRMAAGENVAVATIVERVNRVIQHSALAGTFVSLFYGQLSDDGTLDYCNAGHNPPLLMSGRTLRRLEVGGTVLGPLRDARYEAGREQLRPGDTLVMYTDGLVERPDRAGQFYGLDRLERVVAGLAGQSAHQMAAEVLADVNGFANGLPNQDDMTLVVVRRPSGPGR